MNQSMANLGPTEIILIIALVLVFFGAKKVPELARGLGKGINELKKAAREVEDSSTDLRRSADDAVGMKDLKDTVGDFRKAIRKVTKT